MSLSVFIAAGRSVSFFYLTMSEIQPQCPYSLATEAPIQVYTVLYSWESIKETSARGAYNVPRRIF